MAKEQPMTKFKSRSVPGKASANITSVKGGVATIRIRALKKQERKKLSRTFKTLEKRLPDILLPKLTRDFVLQLLQKLLFFGVTTSPDVGIAYSSCDPTCPLIILHKRFFDLAESGRAVTVLHEVLHFVFDSSDEAPASQEEMEHDLFCYQLLGYEVPWDHPSNRIEAGSKVKLGVDQKPSQFDPPEDA